MRVIKFRAWDEDGFMFAPTQIQYLDNGAIYVWNNDVYGELGSAIIDLMQYTGVKDKNGEEIYEGDLVLDHLTKEVLEVVWYKSAWAWKRTTEHPKAFYKVWAFFYDNHENKRDEVIGNIYENPELLKGGD